MLGDVTAIMLAVIVPVIILTLAFAWWFRAGTGEPPIVQSGSIPVGRSSGPFGAGHRVPGGIDCCIQLRRRHLLEQAEPM